jgi:hypothetical protein
LGYAHELNTNFDEALLCLNHSMQLNHRNMSRLNNFVENKFYKNAIHKEIAMILDGFVINANDLFKPEPVDSAMMASL